MNYKELNCIDNISVNIVLQFSLVQFSLFASYSPCNATKLAF